MHLYTHCLLTVNLQQAYWASESVAAEKELQKRKERCLKRWKKLIVGLRVRNRIQGEYKKNKTDTGSASKTNGTSSVKSEEQERSQFQALSEDKDLPKATPGTNNISQPPDASATSNGFLHTSSLHPSEPGGAAFPPPPDLNGLKLPPMPAPQPRAAFSDVDMDSKVGYPSTLNGHKEKLDLGDFTLLPPEELAEGAPEIGDSEQEAGGFVREEDEDNDDDEKPETSGIVKRDFAQRKGRQAKKPAKAETSESESEVDMEEVQVQKGGSESTSNESEDADDTVDEEAAYEGSPSPSPPPAKRTRGTRATARSAAKKSSERAAVANGQSSRRSTRAATSASPIKASGNSGRSAKPTRPTRAAATRARQAAVIDIGSSEEEDEEQAEDEED
jgi:hypothetical protein